MDQSERIDRIIESVCKTLQGEVEGLLGADFTLVSKGNRLASKADAFGTIKGKHVCAQMEITGDIQGRGCLLVGIKDAIRLGGTLIMLPAAELEEVSGREEYSEEIEDSYGEIANIIAGSFTSDFEEMYPKACRFIRKEQEVVVPSDVDLASQHPVENQAYYMVVLEMTLDGREMGNMLMLMPAETFGIEGDVDTKQAEAGGAEPDSELSSESKSAEVSQTKNTGAPTGLPKLSFEKRKERVDLLLAECQKKMEVEVGGLMGIEVMLSDLENRFVSKGDYFSEVVSENLILADMDVSGARSGKSYFAITAKDAIFLGGSLIMLPPSELDVVMANMEFGEDTKDAYGEIANIVSGVYTSIFEEQHSEKLRFIKTELQEVVPQDVEIESDQPIADSPYYLSSMSVFADGKSLGKIHMLIPVDVLQLKEEKVEQAPEVSQEIAEQESSHAGTEASGDGKVSSADVGRAASEPDVDLEKKKADAKKHKGHIDKLLVQCQGKMEEEVGALLGVDVKLTNLETLVVSKGEFFENQVQEKQVIANLDIVGELEGLSFLSVALRDAIRIGGVLIMLPESELDKAISEDDFTEDSADAYGEIANIISGVYSTVFEEQYFKKIRFIKTGLEQVIPAKVEPEGDSPIPDQSYYLTKMDISIGETKLGNVNLLLPLELLQLGGLLISDSEVEEAHQAAQLGGHAGVVEGGSSWDQTSVADVDSVGTPDILLVSDNIAEGEKISSVLSARGYSVKVVTFKDNIQTHIPGQLKAIYLVMRDVNEQAFGVAIRVSSISTLPLIAAGPDWTRTKVMKAVKYGVRDILLTPATDQDIQENISNNLIDLAA